MFATVATEVSDRLHHVKAFLRTMDFESPARSTEASTCKGMMFVLLYGAYEYTVRSTVQAALAHVKASGLGFQRLKPGVACLALDAHWSSIRDVGRAKLWEKRHDLLREIRADSPVTTLNDLAFPSDASNYRVSQLIIIWALLDIPVPVVAEKRYMGRIEELVENRHAIAHGRVSASAVGRRYSQQEIAGRIDDVDAITAYIIESIRDHSHSGGLYLPQE